MGQIDGERRGLIGQILEALVGVGGKDLQVIWQLVFAMRRNHPRTDEKKLLEQVQFSARRWYLVIWNVPTVIGLEE